MRRAQLNRLFLALLLVADAGTVCGSFFVAWWVRFSTGLVPVTHYPPIGEYLRVLPVTVVVYLVVFNYAGLYRQRPDGVGSAELRLIVPAVLVGALGVFSLGFFYRGFSYSRLLVAFMAVSSMVLLRVTRGALLSAQERLMRRGVGIRRVAILGSQREAKTLAESLERRPGHGFRLVGYIGPRTATHTPYLGDPSELGAILAAERVRELLVVDTGDLSAVAAAAAECQKAGVECRVLANVFGFPTYRLQLEDRFGVPLLSLRPLPLDRPVNRLLKRIVDTVASGLALVALSPVLVVIGLAIKLSSSGPVFFSQERVGRDGKHFRMLKFRSMRGGAEDETGPVWAAQDDPRRTRLGRLLRRWSLDELPQLFNVLKGQMSLVGPRPERAPFVERFSEKYPRYDERHRIAPGMTGWAQVHGLRGNTSIEERTRYDLYYLENWSVWLDIQILVRTVLGLFHHSNAY